MRHVFAAVAVEHLQALSGAFGLEEAGHLVDAIGYQEETEALYEQGFIADDSGDWTRVRVQPIAFLEWCARELRRHAASAPAWETWLGNQGWDLTPEQRRNWIDRVRPGLLERACRSRLLRREGAVTAGTRPRKAAPRAA